MDEPQIIQLVQSMFSDVQTSVADENTFFFVGEERMMPFATLVTKDDYEKVSDLNRPGVFRLNIGLTKPTFLALFGSLPAAPGSSGIIDTGHDFAALDRLMPHPVYGHLSWVGVLNPSDATWEKVKPLLQEAYDLAAGRQAKRAARNA